MALGIGGAVAVGLVGGGVVSVHRLMTGEDVTLISSILLQNNPSSRRLGLSTAIVGLFLVVVIVSVMWGL